MDGILRSIIYGDSGIYSVISDIPTEHSKDSTYIQCGDILTHNIVYEPTTQGFLQVQDILRCDTPIDTNSRGEIQHITKGKIALIDADTIVFQVCTTSQMFNITTCTEEVKLEIALQKAIIKIEDITSGAGCDSCILFFTNDSNFRYIIYPMYKHNRSTVHGRDLVRLELNKLYKSYNGGDYMLEADDTVVAYYDKVKSSGNYVLCGIDKDVLYATSGTHYNYYSKAPYINKKGIKIPAILPHLVYVSDLEVFKMPYFQCLLGDNIDNITGVKGIGKVGANKLLKNVELGDDNMAIFTVLEQYILSMCTEDSYHEFMAGLEVHDSAYMLLSIEEATSYGLDEEQLLENNARFEVVEAIKKFESTMRAVNMQQATYDFIEDTFTLDLWNMPKNKEGKYLYD